MKKILIILFFIPISVLAQSYSLEIINNETGKISYIKENKRIKIRTVTGQKLQGRVTFTDSVSLEIKGTKIPLEELTFIQRRPLGVTLAGIGLLTIGGVGIGISPLILFVDRIGGIAVFATSTGLVGTGIVLPHLSKRYKLEKYTFKIINIEK